jgi:ABC-type nitrate/sulfonate/bicarbonate transport system permease component
MMRRWTIVGARILVIAAIAAVWELAGVREWVDPDLLPPLSRVIDVLWDLLHDRQFLGDLKVTVLECLFAFAIVTPLGLGVGFLIGESQLIERTVGPPLQLLMAVPKSVFLPVFVLMLGIGFVEKVVFAIVLTFFIVVPTGIAAVHTVPRGLVVVAKAFGATRGQIFRRIYVPAVTPIVLSGVRLGLIFSVHGVVFAEMYGSTAGIGRNILIWGEQFQMDLLFAAVLLILILTVAANELMQFCEAFSRSRLQLDETS